MDEHVLEDTPVRRLMSAQRSPEEARLSMTNRRTNRNGRDSPLLRLPAELRNKIYDYVLAVDSGYRCTSRTLEFTKSKHALALLGVCRQTYEETKTLPCKLNVFWFPGLETLHKWVTVGAVHGRSLQDGRMMIDFDPVSYLTPSVHAVGVELNSCLNPQHCFSWFWTHRNLLPIKCLPHLPQIRHVQLRVFKFDDSYIRAMGNTFRGEVLKADIKACKSILQSLVDQIKVLLPDVQVTTDLVRLDPTADFGGGPYAVGWRSSHSSQDAHD